MLAGIGYKVASTLVFACMMAIVKALNQYPVGELVFFRSFFALAVLVAWLAQRREFPRALYTQWLSGHVLRSISGSGSMFMSFAAFSFLPLADVTAIGYTGPLIIVVLAGLWLHERVGPARWFAVGLGFCGVLVMMWEHMGGPDAANPRGAIGASMAIIGAFCVAVAMIQTRRLVRTEHMGAVIFYFQTTAAVLGLALMAIAALWPSSWPLAEVARGQTWVTPEPKHWAILIASGVLGGTGQILMTRSFTLADASIIACFDYTSMIWVILLGMIFLGEFPSPVVLIGAGIVAMAGLIVIWSQKTRKFL